MATDDVETNLPESQLTVAEIIALQVENKLLREFQNEQQGKPKGPDPRAGRKPDPFKGTKADKDTHAIQQWLSRMDIYWRRSNITEDLDKIDFMREYLTDLAGREYDAKIESSGAFETYEALTEWLLEHYSTIDPINTYRDRFFGCYQDKSESFDDYFQRFRTAKNALDVHLPESIIVYLFVAHLQSTYRTQIRSDKDFAEYKDVTLEDVLSKLKRTNPAVVADARHDISIAAAHGPQEFHFVGATNSTNHRKRKGNQPHQARPPPSGNHPQAPRTGNGNTGNTTSLRDLTPGEQQFVERQMQKGGGGIQFFDRVQQNAGWRARARVLHLCYKCAAPQHPGNICTANPPPPPRNSGSLNSLTLFGDDADDSYDAEDPLNFLPQV
jgi:hypothetical protein